jgi:glycosyltransferase involved in cell wall biosynthesis
VRFAIASNGFADGPAQALRDYLVAHGSQVLTIFHPLTPEQGVEHVVTTYGAGTRVTERRRRVPLRPPISFLADPFIPLVTPRVDAWFGFNPLACARGLVARAPFVVLWSVDFVPDRFGSRTVATRVYDRLDRLCCLRADARVELSEAAREARNRRHRLPGDAAEARVVPMGAWLDRVPTTPPDGLARRRVVFLGHLVDRQGVDTLLEALAVLAARGEQFSADVVGTGPLEAALRARSTALGLDASVTFHGYVSEHRDVERILAGSSVAVAPYKAAAASFTRYADPGKLKAYLAAGLPVVLTDVPPNARELAAHAGAEVVDDDPAALATAIARALAAPDRWAERRAAALTYAQRFDWNTLLGGLLQDLGLAVSAPRDVTEKPGSDPGS